MPYTDRGYIRKTEKQYIEEKEEEFTNLFGVVNNSVSDVMWQWFKVLIYERMEIENIHEIGSFMLSISNSVGVFLDKWGEESGIPRKGETQSNGYIEVTYPIDAEASFIIPRGTVFSSVTNNYTSVYDMIIPYAIKMTKTKTGESKDYFPSDVYFVESVLEIRNSLNEVINESYYSFDETYNNNIQWTESSSAVIQANETYYVYFWGDVTLRVEVASEEYGVNSNASIGTITTCETFPELRVNNSEEVTGGAEEESDDSYRRRLLNVRRRTFTLDSIKTIITAMNGVRACKVFQTTGVDQSSVDDWDNPILGSDFVVTGTLPSYSQSFVPGEHIATLGKITLRGRAVGDPPGIYIGVKGNYGNYATGDYFDYDYIEEYELDQSVTGWWDIPINVLYNGMDKTKTYRFDVWCKDPENESFDWINNYWEIRSTTENYRGDTRGLLYEMGTGGNWESMGNGIDLMFKTHFNGAGYNAIIAPEDGYGYDNILEEVEDKLDYVDGEGYAPICIQPYFEEAVNVKINTKCVIYTSPLSTFEVVKSNLQTMINTYLDNLDIGSQVVYSRIWQVIMNHSSVIKLENLYIQRDGYGWVQRDIGISENEIPYLGTFSIQNG